MRSTGKLTKRAVSLLLCLALLVSVLAFALTVRAEEVEDLADIGTDTIVNDSPENNGGTESPKELADTGAAGDYIYCKNTAGWSTVTAYMWIKDTHDGNAAWPGLAMTKVKDNIWRYQVPSDSFNMIIFSNNGESQSADLDYPGAGYIYDNSTKQWSVYEVQPTTPKPTSGVTPTTPQPTQGGSASGKTYVYCENEAGWNSVYCYMWVKDTNNNNNAAWPGVKMTNIGGNTWRYEVTKNTWNMIIFNIGSDSAKSGDMSFPGKDYIWNNKTEEWSIYDTSPLQVSSFATDMESPQYAGTGVMLSAAAEGQGTVYYKFSVTNSSGATTVLKDFSTANAVRWIPQAAGTYTLTYDFKDAKGNINKRTKSYVIEDGSSVVAPFIKTVTPYDGDIANNANVTITVAAGGGKTGTNLLFYKYTVKNASGAVVNVPYYTRNTSYTFKPTELGLHTVTIRVQGSDNKTVERSYVFNSVGAVVPTTPPETQPPVQPTQAPPAPTQPKPTAPPATQAPTQPKPTEPPAVDILLGDADDDGDVTIVDVTFIQRYEAGLELVTPLNVRNADVDADDEVTIIDATLVQRYNAGIISKFPAES